jgi:hypothetical protein
MRADLRQGWSGPPAALIPKLIVRVRFSSPAPRGPAQVRSMILSPGLDRFQALDALPCN